MDRAPLWHLETLGGSSAFSLPGCAASVGKLCSDGHRAKFSAARGVDYWGFDTYLYRFNSGHAKLEGTSASAASFTAKEANQILETAPAIEEAG